MTSHQPTQSKPGLMTLADPSDDNGLLPAVWFVLVYNILWYLSVMFMTALCWQCFSMIEWQGIAAHALALANVGHGSAFFIGLWHFLSTDEKNIRIKDYTYYNWRHEQERPYLSYSLIRPIEGGAVCAALGTSIALACYLVFFRWLDVDGMLSFAWLFAGIYL